MRIVSLPRTLLSRNLLLVVLSAAAVLGAALAIMPALGVGPANPKADNPFAGMSREDRIAAERAVGADVASRQANFVAGFVQSGADLHSLPTANINRLTVSSASLEDAVAAATLVVRGTVVAQHLDRRNGRVVSELRVSEAVSGQTQPQSVSVSQVGGPQLNGDTAVLVQTSDDPILWRGRDYLLLLGPCSDSLSRDEYCTTVGGRQFEIQAAGTIAPADNEGWAAALRGTSVAELTERVRAAASKGR